MMECSDLSAPKSAKGFVKPSVKDVQVKRGATITYQSSQKARTWQTTDTSELDWMNSSLFYIWWPIKQNKMVNFFCPRVSTL